MLQIKNKPLWISFSLFALTVAASLSTSIFAALPEGSSTVFIEIKGQPVDPSSLPPELRNQVQSPSEYEGDSIPSPRLRDELFQRAGLEEDVKELDHLSRDLLIYRASRLPLSELKKRYPNLSASGLSQLQAQLQTLKQKKGTRK